MYLDNNMQETSNQEVLTDKNSSGKEHPWRIHKISSIELSKSFFRLKSPKRFRVTECSNYMEFKNFAQYGSRKLNKANFCKVRLCPMCSWRRSLKIFGQASKVMTSAVNEKGYRFLFLTLTCKNVYGEDLSKIINELFSGFNRLTKRKIFKKTIKGWFRALEVTHNLDINSTSYDTYHAHFHVVLLVNKSYFSNKNYYITQKEWTALWKDCLEVDYNPIVDVRSFKSEKEEDLIKSVAESSKYAVKSNDFIVRNENGDIDEEMTDKSVSILDSALSNRRLTAYGGKLREIHKKLNLDDAENGDLINTGNEEELREDLDYIIERYFWNVGYSNYVKM